MSHHEKAFIPYSANRYDREMTIQKSAQFYELMDQRRSLRMFSDETIPEEVLENIIMTASSAPSGAHKQPWSFCLISDPSIKKKIRVAAEEEEYRNYHGRMSEEWLADLAPFDTNWQKPFLEIAPYLIVMFKKPYDLVDGAKKKNYYVNESVGIAAGFLLAAIHQAGLVSLTHTPSPMNFLQELLERPENERAYLLIPVGYPAEGAQVPLLERKAKQEVMYRY